MESDNPYMAQMAGSRATGQRLGSPQQPLVSDVISALSEMHKRLIGVNDVLTSTRNRVFGSSPEIGLAGQASAPVEDTEAARARDLMAECLATATRTERLAQELSSKL